MLLARPGAAAPEAEHSDDRPAAADVGTKPRDVSDVKPREVADAESTDDSAQPPEVRDAESTAGVNEPVETPEVSGARRALAVVAAIVPGFGLRGIGSWIVGERRTGKRLAKVAVGSLVVAGAAGSLVGLTHANPWTMFAMPLVLAGAGGLLTSWVEDIWIAAGGSALAAGPRAPASWSVELGETWQHDVYRERLLQRAAATVAIGRFGAGTAAMIDTNGESWLVFGDVRARVYGDATCADCIVARVGGRVQRDRADRVTQVVGEVELMGRLGLARFDKNFRSNFVELSSGIGVNRITYASMVSEVESLLLGRFAWGSYIPGGEVTVYYDHRRDGLAGGINAWRASGFIGSFGATAEVRIDGPWTLRGEFQIGNAYLSTLALAYRGGTR